MPEPVDPAYRRVLLKYSGEALMGTFDYGIDPSVIGRVAAEVREIVDLGVQVAMVIGGGNIFRGAGLAGAGMDRVQGDYMGMLATVMNALAIQDALQRAGTPARVLSALAVDQVCEKYSRAHALAALAAGEVVVLAAGTGNPFFTTDSAASLRGIELGVELVLKGTKVDGVYSADPMKEPQAIRYATLSYAQAIEEGLKVMDTTALVLCRDHDMLLRVFDMTRPGALLRVVKGEDVGTLVHNKG